MPRLFYRNIPVTLALLLAFSICRAQITMSAALDTLVKKQLITTHEKALLFRTRAWFEKLRKDKRFGPGLVSPIDGRLESPLPDYTRRDQLLRLLTEVKKFSTSGTLNILSFIPAPVDITHLPRAVIRSRLNSFVQKLYLAGLASNYTKNELLLNISKDKLDWEVEVADAAYIGANQESFLQPGKLKKFADSLHLTKVISDTNYRLLMEKSRRGQLHRYTEIPPYLDYAITIPTQELPRDSIGFLKALYARTSEVYPGLGYDSIKFQVRKDKAESDTGFDVYNLISTVWKSARPFSYSGFYYAVYKNKRDEPLPVPDKYFAVFNKMLANLSSPYRLHSVSSDSDHMTIIALTEKQFKEFNREYDDQLSSYVNVGYNNDSHELTQGAIDSAIKVYDSIGLFSHLSVAGKDSGIAVVSINEINHYSDILRCFPNTVFDIDAEYGIDSGQYAGITKQVALISKGQFRPENLIDGYSYENKHFTYGFTFHDQVYTSSLYQEGKYLDSGFWELIEKAEKEKDLKGQFYVIYPSDGLTVIYLTKEQYAFLKVHKLLEFDYPDINDE